MIKIRLRRYHVLLAGLLAAVGIGTVIAHSRATSASTTKVSAEVSIQPAASSAAASAPAGASIQPAPSPSAGSASMNQPYAVYYRNKVAVLTYHHFDSAESSVTITPERFKSHLDTLKDHGFQVISMNDFIGFLQKKAAVPPNAVVLTFDDGYESVYKYAYPILKSEGLTGTTFMIVSYIEDGKAHQPSIMNWTEITAMHRDGFDFYSHSFNSHDSVYDSKGKEFSPLVLKQTVNPGHHQETDAQYKERIRNDLTKADDILNGKLGNSINMLCLPHGQYNATVLQAANQAGIPYLFTGNEGLNAAGDTILKRINAGSPYMTKELLIKRLSQQK